MKKILLVRHAESIANKGEATNTPPDGIPLSDLGFSQAENLIKEISLVPEIFIKSKYLRTQQTASPIINKMPQIPHEVWDMVHEFTYLDSARCIKMNTLERKPLVEEYWLRNDPYYNDGGNAESFHDFLLRIDDFIKKIKKRPENKIIIFTHGQFITGFKMLMQIDGLPQENELKKFMYEFRKLMLKENIPNAAIFDASELLDK